MSVSAGPVCAYIRVPSGHGTSRNVVLGERNRNLIADDVNDKFIIRKDVHDAFMCLMICLSGFENRSVSADFSALTV